MNIGEIFNQVNNAINNMSGNSGEGMQTPGELSLSLQRGLDILDSLPVGSNISGTVVGFNEGNLLLQLSEGNMIEARLEGLLDPAIGSRISLMIKGNADGNITLSPLFANTDHSSTVSNALSAAGIPDTPQMHYMVRSMMEEGLPIDRNSLADMVRNVNEFPLNDPKDIALLQRLNIPINEEMLTQLEHYRNYEHTIGNSLSDLSDSFLESSVQMLSSEDPKEAIEFIKNTLDILLPDNEGQTLREEMEVRPDTEAVREEAPAEVLSKEVLPEDIKDPLKEVLPENVSDKNVLPKIENEDGTSPARNEAILAKEEDTAVPGNKTITPERAANDPVRLLYDKLNELTGKEKIQPDDKAYKEITDILKNEDFAKNLKEQVSRQWMLKPEDVAREGSVRELYDRLNAQIKSLTDSLSAENRPNTPIAQTANNISGNINFMNELNQTFNYVQIPLKLEGRDKTGELFVYTNKRSLSSKDGNVSALLHLDMDNLGPVDVHVVLNESNNVKTKFMLKDDAALDLIAKNIEVLNARLNKRGYSMNAEFVNNVDDKTLFENMIGDEHPVPIMSDSSFDARA